MGIEGERWAGEGLGGNTSKANVAAQRGAAGSTDNLAVCPPDQEPGGWGHRSAGTEAGRIHDPSLPFPVLEQTRQECSHLSLSLSVFNVYVLLRERERERESGGGAESEGDTESEAGLRLQAVSTGPDSGLEPMNREIMT